VDERPQPADAAGRLVRLERGVVERLRDDGIPVLLGRSVDGLDRLIGRRCGGVGDGVLCVFLDSHALMVPTPAPADPAAPSMFGRLCTVVARERADPG
jgi:hypothetical protein